LGIAIQSQRGEGRVTGPALLYVVVEKRKIDYNYLKKGERRQPTKRSIGKLEDGNFL
jgi:hypothetical protein